MQDRLFVSVASFCDPMLAFTLDSARSQAAHPDRLFFGVVDQSMPGGHLRRADVWSHRQVRHTRVDARESRGACWARALAMALFEGEDWFLQVDSHTWFEPGWDERFIALARRCQVHGPRVIVSSYPNPFEMTASGPVARPVTHRVLASVVQGDAEFRHDHPQLGFTGYALDRDEPVSGFQVSAGCLFAPGRLVDELPYDARLYFHGEEQSFSLRAWTRGWDIYHVPGVPLYHLYTVPGTAPRPMHWSAELDAVRAESWVRREEASNARFQRILDGAEGLGPYGLGSVRSLSDFAVFSGIDYANRRVAAHARAARFDPGTEPADGR